MDKMEWLVVRFNLNVNTRVLTNNQTKNNDFYIENLKMYSILLS